MPSSSRSTHLTRGAHPVQHPIGPREDPVSNATEHSMTAPQMGQTNLKANSLGFIGVAFFVISAAAPMAAFVGASPVIFSIMGPVVPLI